MGFGRRPEENGAGDRAIGIDGRVLGLPDTLDVEDALGEKLCRVHTLEVALDASAHSNQQAQCVRS
jgi:uncharacterized protein YxjI